MTQAPSPYRLVVVDLDGTLLDEERLVRPEIRSVVERASELGVRFTVATGRVFSSALPVARLLGLDELLISDGGAVLRHPRTGEVLRDLRIDRAVAVAILEAVAAEDLDCHVFFPDSNLVNRLSNAVLRYGSRLGVEMTAVPDLAAAARLRPEGPTMIVLRTTAERAPALRQRHGAAFGNRVRVTSTAPHFVDFLHREASKAGALEQLCGRLGIRPEQVIAIGDGINDLDMLDYAGVGALVGNADPELWRHADYVAQKPYHRGVVEVMERFCLG